jgi:CRP-like cAMP-binding protein
LVLSAPASYSYRFEEPSARRPQAVFDDSLAIEDLPLFSGISSADFKRIKALAHSREFARGENMCIEGDAVQQVLLIASGLVKTTQVGLSGSEVILKLSASGDVLGVSGLLTTGRHPGTVQAFRLCRTLAWDVAVFKAIMERNPVLHLNLLRILGAEVLELEQRFREVATERVGLRVARQLERLREKIGRPVNGVVEIGLSREELAQMTGTTLYTVSRLLSAWEARGLVKARREVVEICDVQLLHAVSAEE